MACTLLMLRRRLLAAAGPLVVATMVSSCAVKAPPDTAAIKEQALPALQTPADWAVVRVPGVGAVVEGWLLAFNDEQLTAAVNEAIAHNADLRVGAARVEQALLHAKLAGAKLYPSVDLLARGGGKLSGDGSGLQGAILTAKSGVPNDVPERTLLVGPASIQRTWSCGRPFSALRSTVTVASELSAPETRALLARARGE